MKKYLQWIAVPFAAVIAMVLAHAVIHILSGFNGAAYEFLYANEPVGVTEIGCALLRDFMAGMAFVYGGSIVAPSNNKTTAIVLATILGVFCVGNAILAICMKYSFLEILGITLTAVGGIYYSACKESDIKKEESNN